VKELYGMSGLAATAAIVMMAGQAMAAPTQVTNVRVAPSGNGIDVVLDTIAGDRPPQVFNVNRGNTWTAYVFNTQLKGQAFQQNNPAAGIASVTVSPVGGNGIQVVVVGQSSAPMGQVTSRTGQGLVLSVNSAGGAVAQAPAATPAAPAKPAAKPPAGPLPATSVAPLVPNPQVNYTGTPAIPTAPVPPLQQRAIAPPVGDIALSQLDTSPTSIDLGSAERIPRLVLRDAPVREVLSLLARAAGMNLAFAEGSTSGPGAAARAGTSTSGGPTISLDIENESVQDVFNYVLRIACVPATGQGGQGGGGQCASLEATRNGRTIFVGPKLPNAARGLVARSMRLNQMAVSSAVNFLVGLGAESAVTKEREVKTVVAQSAAQLEGAQQGQSQGQAQQTTTETRVEVQRVNFQDNVPFLRGVQVLGDERTNSITIIGESRKVEFATNQLVHLDLRRRLVAVNVKVIDVNLIALKRTGTSFSFGVNDAAVINQAGVAIVNFGRQAPGTTGPAFTTDAVFGQSNVGSAVRNAVDTAGGNFNFTRDFFAQLQAAITNDNAKILTDPTLVVQEGQTATVNLTQEVVTNFKQDTSSAGGGSVATVTVTVEKKAAGLILPVKVDRIDDNGYVSLSVAPSISQPDGVLPVTLGGSTNTITLLSERKLESGQIRLRDGQTLVLSGIIQEQDRTSVTKVPLLGDIPLLGALFRRTERINQRREVIVLLTPQIIDDSDKANYGYSYAPGAEVQKLLREQGKK
jgi:type IV pilus assembly protein PilQ